MEQQIAPTLWLPPGVCLLNPVPTMQLQPTSHHHIASQHITSQLLKQQMITHTVPPTNFFQNQHLLQPTQLLQTTGGHNLIHIPGLSLESIPLPPSGKQTYEIQPPTAPMMEIPLNLQVDKQISLPTSTTIIPHCDATFQRHLMASKVTKKKRISPSAKRRSRLRLIAFLESKKKQQSSLCGSTEQTDENNGNCHPSSSPDVTATSPVTTTTITSSDDEQPT